MSATKTQEGLFSQEVSDPLGVSSLAWDKTRPQVLGDKGPVESNGWLIAQLTALRVLTESLTTVAVLVSALTRESRAFLRGRCCAHGRLSMACGRLTGWLPASVFLTGGRDADLSN